VGEVKLSVGLKFKKASKDSLKLKIKDLVLSDGLETEGTTLSLSVGGISVEALLDRKGRFKSADKRDKVKLKQKKKTGLWTLSWKRKKSSLLASLQDEGVEDADQPKPGLEVDLELLVDDGINAYGRTETLTYRAKMGKGGKLK